MNTLQKLGCFVGALALAILTFLHAPWYGYDTQNKPYRVFNSFTYVPESIDRPFWDWISIGAIVPRLVALGDFLIAVGLVVALVGFWVYLFRSAKSSQS